MSDRPLRLLILGAHPDDAEFHAGGLATSYRRLGYEVRMVSMTNGQAGHHERPPQELAQLRRQEAAAAGRVINAEYVTWDVPGALQGGSPLETIPANDDLVYALRFVGESRDSQLLLVAAAEREGLRRVSTPAEVDAFLKALAETVAAVRHGAKRPADVARATMGAGNDLTVCLFHQFLCGSDVVLIGLV